MKVMDEANLEAWATINRYKNPGEIQDRVPVTTWELDRYELTVGGDSGSTEGKEVAQPWLPIVYRWYVRQSYHADAWISSWAILGREHSRVTGLWV